MTNTEKTTTSNEAEIKELFGLGAHIGYSRAKRHPAVRSFVFGFKNKTTVIDLEKTIEALRNAENYAKELGSKGKTILFVGTKAEAAEEVKKSAERVGLPHVTSRWIGGTLTNFSEIKKRVDRMLDLKDKKEKGELSVYTKKEQGLIAKEVADLEKLFGGLVSMKKLPDAIFAIDSDHEKIAIAEARSAKMKVIALSSSDCDIRTVDYPVLANDSSKGSIAYFVNKIAEAYKKGLAQATTPEVSEEKISEFEK